MATHPKLRDVMLDDRSLAYLEKVLGDGGELSHVVLERLHQHPFRVHTLLPADVDVESAYGFDQAIISATDMENRVVALEKVGAVFDSLLDSVIGHLRSGPDAICLFEHIWGSAGDPWIRDVDFVSQREGVLLFLTPSTLSRLRDRSTLATTVHGASTTLFLCALLRDSEWPTWLIRDRSVSATRLRNLTRNPFTAVTRAWDDEGYIYLDLE
jgi:hypothetical protein